MVDTGGCASDRSLAGLRVLVTRPRHQSAGLVTLIEKRGGTALPFPVIDILPPRDARAAQAVFASLDDYALAIFLSPNAVTHGLAHLHGADPREIRARLVAVGESTARALEQAGCTSVLRPREGSSSEALLALPELDGARVAGARVLIVRGESGRQLLGDTLSKRGARVTYAEVYRRGRPRSNGSGLAERGRDGGIDTIVVTSLEGLENLFALLGEGGTGWLKQSGYVVASERLANHARALGIEGRLVIATGADDESLLAALFQWREVYSNDGN